MSLPPLKWQIRVTALKVPNGTVQLFEPQTTASPRVPCRIAHKSVEFTSPPHGPDIAARDSPLHRNAFASIRGRPGRDRTWLGHESVETTHGYVEADLTMMENALGKLAPAGSAPGRFRASDDLLAFLATL